MEKRVYNLAFGKKYIASNQQEKKVWVQVGRMFVEPESEYGERISIRLDAIPTDPQFNGLISAFPHEERQAAQRNGAETDDIEF